MTFLINKLCEQKLVNTFLFFEVASLIETYVKLFYYIKYLTFYVLHVYLHYYHYKKKSALNLMLYDNC